MYFDSAYIAKYYLNEPDSNAVRRAIQAAPSLVSSMWAMGEVTCAFHRYRREGALDEAQVARLVDSFLGHVDAGIWTLLPMTEALVRRMISTVRSAPASVYLRAGDAVHLATARDAGEGEIWTSDRHVLAAAPLFGLAGRRV